MFMKLYEVRIKNTKELRTNDSEFNKINISIFVNSGI